jgi:hypothetical protein
MTGTAAEHFPSIPTEIGQRLALNVQLIGIVYRNDGLRFPNGRRDFSYVLKNVLRSLGQKKCDTAIFSLFTLEPRATFSASKQFKVLRHIRTVQNFMTGVGKSPSASSCITASTGMVPAHV